MMNAAMVPRHWETAKISQKMSSIERGRVIGGPSRRVSRDDIRKTQDAKQISPGPIGAPSGLNWVAVDSSRPTESSTSSSMVMPPQPSTNRARASHFWAGSVSCPVPLLFAELRNALAKWFTVQGILKRLQAASSGTTDQLFV